MTCTTAAPAGLPAGATAVLAHGAGSTADLVRRAFGPALARLGVRLVTWQQQPDPATWLPQLDALVREHHAALVGGVSLGAHVSAHWAARAGGGSGSVRGLLLVMPGWTGRPRPGSAAAGPRLTADAVTRDGVAATLDTVRRSAPGWVADEMTAAWTRWPPGGLAAHLRAAAESAAPTLADLRTLTLPSAVVTVRGDPLHPHRVGAAWAKAMPNAALTTITLDDLGHDRAALGDAAVTGWRAALASGVAVVSTPR